MPPLPREHLLAIAVALLLVGIWLGHRLARWLRSRLARRRQRIGAAGERRALKLLAREGYRVLRTQVPGELRLRIDGEPRAFEVRADALVRRRRKTFVAEIKTGRAAGVGNRWTRRQLLEYAHAYDVDGLLLVDATRGVIHSVELP